jgi:hypothetical protein
MLIKGSGLGLRRGMLDEMSELTAQQVDFFEVAPENWMGLGGRFGKVFRELTERFPFACHGLSLSIGSSDPLDVTFVKAVKQFLDTHQIEIYSEHLSYCSHQGHMYDLLPIPFTQDAITHVVGRIQQVQDILQRPLILENVSTYAKFGDMSELEFTQDIIARSGCKLLLDVNNVYVNSINHQYDAMTFIQALPSHAVEYMHIAGHFDEADDLKVDTHGAPIKESVWQLLKLAYDAHGIKPTLLERDFNFPPMHELLEEVDQIKSMQEVAYA